MITPLPGYIVDPSNNNGVIRDPNVATAPGGYPSIPTVSAPANPGSLQGTLTSPQPPATPTPASGNGAPQPPVSTPGAGLDPASFMNVIQGVQQKFSQNNDLIAAKNLLIKGLFTSPLTADEVAQLPPDLQQVWNTGNKDAIELQLSDLNSRIQGGTNNFSSAVNYLVNGYNTSVQQAEQAKQDAEKQRQDAISNVQAFVQAYGSNAGKALTSLYGPGYIDTLKNAGIDINSFASVPTLAETKQEEDNAVKQGTPVADYNGDFAATIQLAANANKNSSAAQRAAVTNALQTAIASGDYKTAYQAILQATKSNLTGTSATRLENAITLNSTLGDLQTALQAYANAGGNTNILTGTEDDIQTKIGQLKTDPKYAALAVQLDSAYQNYRLMLTGANFSQAEASAYASVLPQKGNSLALNLAKIQGAQAAANSTVEGAIKGVVGDGGIYIKQYAEGATPQGSASSSSDLESQVKAAGYDYAAMKAAGYSDDAIKAAVGLK